MRGAAILFDFDGVVIDSRIGVQDAFDATLAAHALPQLAADEIHTVIGPPIHVSLRAVSGRDDVEELVDTYHRIYRDTCVRVEVIAGMPEALAALGAHYVLALATSKPEPFTRAILESAGLAEHFDVVGAPSLADPSEPKAATIDRTMRELPVPPVCLVGDTRFDVEAGAAHGLPVVGVTWGFGSEEELRSAGAATIARSPSALVEAIAALTRSGS